MEFKTQKDVLQDKTARLRLFEKLCLILAVTCLISAIACVYTLRHREVVLVPMNLTGSATVSNSAVDASYLEAIATTLINARYNVNYVDVDKMHQFLLQYTDNSFLPTLSPVLVAEAADIKSQQMTSLFVVDSVKADPSNLTMEISGTLQEWSNMVGNNNNSLPDQSKVIDLQFSYSGGQLKLKGWGEKHANQ